MASSIAELRQPDYRTVWISDVHPGSRDCKALLLLDFLKSVNSDCLYLVGDIVDLWRMKKSVHWPQEHNDVVRTILSKAKRGVRVVYIPGNHDELLRDFDGMRFGNVIIRTVDTHTTANGRQYLVMHGDEFDSAVKCNSLLSFIGSRAYTVMLEINRGYNHVRRRLGLPYRSLANFIKHRVNNAVKYINRFEHAVAHEAGRQQVDGLICGHIHRARLRRLDGVEYCNAGDWVESCTALVEHFDGALELINWAEHRRAESGRRLPSIGRAA